MSFRQALFKATVNASPASTRLRTRAFFRGILPKAFLRRRLDQPLVDIFAGMPIPQRADPRVSETERCAPKTRKTGPLRVVAFRVVLKMPFGGQFEDATFSSGSQTDFGWRSLTPIWRVILRMPLF